MKSFFAALKFLTVLPVPASWTGGEDHLSRSVYYYPVIGIIIGTLIALADRGLMLVLPGTVVPVLLVIIMIVLTGGLHADGLSDTFDGFFSSKSREKILSIMRDSQIGVMGSLSIISVFLLKLVSIYSLSAELRGKVLLLVLLAGRCCLLLHWLFLPYARKEGGIASVFSRRQVVISGILGLILLFTSYIYLLGLPGLYTVLSVTGFTILFSIYCFYKISGMTGDTLGATCELSECAALVGVLTFN